MEIKYGRICGKVAVMDDKVFIQDMIKGTVIEADCPDDWADLIADASAMKSISVFMARSHIMNQCQGP